MSGKENSSTDSTELPRVSPIAEDILHQIAAAGDQQITLFPLHQDLAIPKHQLRYSLTEKLSDLSYIETWTPDGTMTACLDGQQRAFSQPMHVALTETDQQYLDQYYSATAPERSWTTANSLAGPPALKNNTRPLKTPSQRSVSRSAAHFETSNVDRPPHQTAHHQSIAEYQFAI